MIIFNGREVPCKYLKTDEIILEINSTLSLEALTEKVRNNESLEDIAIVSAYKKGTGQCIPLPAEIEIESVGDSDIQEIIPELDIEKYNILQNDKKNYIRPLIFDEYEKYQFNRGDVQFVKFDVSHDILLKELMAGCGIFPTLYDEEKSIAELKKISIVADKKYIGHSELTEDNPIFARNAGIYVIPNKEDIYTYYTLNDYEKRIVNESQIPFCVLGYSIRKLRENDNYRTFTAENISKLNANFYRLIGINEAITDFKHPLLRDSRNQVKFNQIDEAFKVAFKGRSPRVLEEYVNAQCIKKDLRFSTLSQETIDEIVKNFDMKSVSKIAKYKSPFLFALSDEINFNEVREDLIEACGALVSQSQIGELIQKGFVEWFKANKNVNVSELSNLFENCENIEKIDAAKTVAEMVLEKELTLADTHRKNYETRYHYRFADNEIAIKGRHIEAFEGNMHMYMLAPNDLRNFTVAYGERDEGINNTNCCQMWGDAGESCVWKYTTDPFAACVVIENTRDHSIMAQGFVWTDEKQNCLVFDNIEFQNDRDVSKFYGIIAKWCENMPYNTIQMGMGYNALGNGVGKPYSIAAKLPTTLSDKYVYSDYHIDNGNKARDLKTNGHVNIKSNDSVRVTIRPDEPTRWDVLTRPELSFLLNDCSMSIDERFEFAENFLHNPDNATQLFAVRKNIEAIKAIENPTLEVQRYVVQHNKDYIKYINNPASELQAMLVEEEPENIRKMCNPPESACLVAVKYDGMLIQYIAQDCRTENVSRCAVEQNGYAIRFINNPSIETQVLAVRNNPKVVTLINNPDIRVIKAAIDMDPTVISIIDNPRPDLQVYAVEKKASAINGITHPCYEAVKRAVEKDGLMIRNYQYIYPQLRRTAINSNPFAVKALYNPTVEEYILAAQKNRNVLMFIKNPQIKNQVINGLNVRQIEHVEELER